MITLEARAHLAPGCIAIVNEDGRRALIQSDYDYPGTASTFGWNMADTQQPDRAEPCPHRGTDGTVDCPDCGLTAGDFIAAAQRWIDDNDGATADDPGYFEDTPE